MTTVEGAPAIGAAGQQVADDAPHLLAGGAAVDEAEQDLGRDVIHRGRIVGAGGAILRRCLEKSRKMS